MFAALACLRAIPLLFLNNAAFLLTDWSVLYVIIVIFVIVTFAGVFIYFVVSMCARWALWRREFVEIVWSSSQKRCCCWNTKAGTNRYFY